MVSHCVSFFSNAMACAGLVDGNTVHAKVLFLLYLKKKSCAFLPLKNKWLIWGCSFKNVSKSFGTASNILLSKLPCRVHCLSMSHRAILLFNNNNFFTSYSTEYV